MKVNREKLLNQLDAVTPGLAAKEILQQSNCFVFQGGRVITFNDEVSCSAASPLEDIEGAIPAVKLLELLRKLPDDDIDIKEDGGKLFVKGKRWRATIRLEAEIALPVEGLEQPGKWKKLPEEFCKAVDLVRECAGVDQSQFVLTCVNIHPKWVEACDQMQMIRYSIKTGLDKPVLVRRDSLKGLSGLDATEIAETENWLHFRNGDGVMFSCRRYMETYVFLDDVLEAKGKRTKLPKGLSEAVERAGIFADDLVEKRVTVSLSDGKMQLSGSGDEGDYRELKRAEWTGGAVEFSTTPKLLIEVGKRADSCEVCEGKLKVATDRWTYMVCTRAVEGDDDA